MDLSPVSRAFIVRTFGVERIEYAGDIHDKSVALARDDGYRRCVAFFYLVGPADVYPAADILGLKFAPGIVCAVGAVDGNALAARYIADYIVAGYRSAAAREFYQAVIQSSTRTPCTGLTFFCACCFAALGGLGDLFENGLLPLAWCRRASSSFMRFTALVAAMPP